MRLLLLATVLAAPALALGQGQLSPPASAFSGGAPTSTMKTLDQLEPRQVLGTPGTTRTSGLTISTSGSYVLAGPIAVASGNAITISASNVTLDLNGFTLKSTNPARTGAAIAIADGCSAISITNGFIESAVQFYINTGGAYGAGFSDGILSDGTTSHSIHVTEIDVHSVLNHGILLLQADADNRLPTLDTSIENCTATDCGMIGLSANRVARSQADSQRRGIQAEVATDCIGESSTSYGLDARVADSCIGLSRTGIGLGGFNGCTATNCYGLNARNDFEDIDATGPALEVNTALNCYAQSSTNYGLRATIAATGCLGRTSNGLIGLAAPVALACVGINTKSIDFLSGAPYHGLYSGGTASFCHGAADADSATALSASIAIGCTAAGHVVSASKQLGTP